MVCYYNYIGLTDVIRINCSSCTELRFMIHLLKGVCSWVNRHLISVTGLSNYNRIPLHDNNMLIKSKQYRLQ